MAQESVRLNSVSSSAGRMGVATFLSRIFGLVREQVFAAFFGASLASDAFQIAFRIPNLLRDLFAEGAMSAALVPTWVETSQKEGDRRAWRLAGLVFRVLFVAVGIFAIFGILTASHWVAIYAPGFKDRPEQFALTVQLTQVMFPFFPLVAVAAAFMAVLNANHVYFWPAFASALFNVASVVVGVACVYLAPHFGFEPIVGMAIGVVVGGAVQALSQIPSLRRVGYRFPKRQAGDLPWYQDAGLRKMLWLMIPGTFALAATQINVLVNSVLATSQGAGAVSCLQYSFRLMQFPIGIFGVSLAAATLPQISRLWVARDGPATALQLESSLKQVLAINLPASAGLAFLSRPIIELLYRYGRFDEVALVGTSAALRGYAMGLAGYSVVKVLVPACYALGASRIAVRSSAISVVTNLLVSSALVQRFGFEGLAWGTSVNVWITSAILLWGVNSRLKTQGAAVQLRPLLKGFFQHAVLALIMGVGVAAYIYALDQWGWTGDRGVLFRVFRTLSSCLLGAGVVLWLGSLFHLSETQEVQQWFSRRLVNRFKRSSKTR